MPMNSMKLETSSLQELVLALQENQVYPVEFLREMIILGSLILRVRSLALNLCILFNGK